MAQTSPSEMLDQFRAVQATWLATTALYANRLFGILALIEVAWSGAVLVLEKTDLQSWTTALVRRIMFIGAFYALLIFGTDWIPRIIESFQIVGQTASGMPALAPTDVLVRGLNIAGNLLSGAAQSGWMADFGTALALTFAALLAFLAFLGLTVQLVVTLVESYLVIGAGFLFLGFGGARWTAPYVERYIAFAVSTGVKVMVLYLLIGAGMSLTNTWEAAALAVPNGTEPAVDALDIAASAVILLMICWNAPKLCAGILGGSPAFTGGDMVGTVGGIAQGALLVGAAAAGGVALGARAFGGHAAAMGTSQAASLGFEGGSAAGAIATATPRPPSPTGGNLGSSANATANSSSVGNASSISPNNNPADSGWTAPTEQSKPPGWSGTPRSDPTQSDGVAPSTPGQRPSQVAPPSANRPRASGIGKASENAVKGLAVTSQFARTAQAAIPPDAAPPATPPPFRTEGGE